MRYEEVFKEVPTIVVEDRVQYVPLIETKIVEKIVEIPQVQYRDVFVTVPEVRCKEVVKEVPNVVIEDRVQHVPQNGGTNEQMLALLERYDAQAMLVMRAIRELAVHETVPDTVLNNVSETCSEMLQCRGELRSLRARLGMALPTKPRPPPQGLQPKK